MIINLKITIYLLSDPNYILLYLLSSIMNSLSKKAGVHPPLKDKLKDKIISLK